MSNLFSSGGAGNVGASDSSGIDQQSLKFNDDETQYLSWTPSSASNRKTWTWSAWVKRGNLGLKRLFTAGTSGSSYLQIRFDTDDEILCSSEQPSTVLYLKTTQKFRDTSAWYHLVVVMDTTQSTAADRTKLYVNGSLVTDFSSTTRPSQNTDLLINSSTAHMIGALSYGATSDPYDGYLSDINFIDGQALDASSFGETVDGYWKAKAYDGTYGTNGFHLTFKDDVVSEGFNTVTYRGTGATQSISGLGFEPDFVWTKGRSTRQHLLFDTIRGNGAYLLSTGTNSETTDTNTLTTFDSDGFTIGSNQNINTSGEGFVAWAWDAGSGSAASNTEGSITSTVKSNPDYGFSVVSYVGNGTHGTIGHGLSGLDMVIVKNRDDAENWAVWHSGIAITKYLRLNSTNAAATPARKRWNDTSPTSTVFSVGDSADSGDNEINANGDDYIAYCFAEVAGYSSISSYTGDGTTDGSKTITTGFRPGFVMMKNTSSGSTNWLMFDSSREPDPTIELELNANNSNAEGNNGRDVTFTNTGFTVAGNNNINGNGDTYIYMAFKDTREAAFWKDVSGQGNNWTPNNLDYRDSLPDSPANNFATLNPLFTNGGATQNFKEGNLQFTADGNYALANGTFAMRTGKWYWETYIKSWVSVPVVGISRGTNTANNSYVGYDPNGNVKGFGYSSGGIIYGASGVGTSAGSQLASGQTTYTTGDIIGCSFDADAGELKFYKNGTLIYTVSSIDEFDWMPATSAYNGGVNIANFGQDSTFAGATTAGGNADGNGVGDFKYAVPSGFLALASFNLPTPTIVDGSEHFNTVLYTGNAGTQSITGVGFDPDFTWAKNRASASYHHELYDTVRGDNKRVFSSQANAEATGYLQFVSDGFSLTAGGGINANTNNHVAWNWKAGGTAVSNTDGSITSQVSANVDAGFSIVTWTQGSGNTSVGHGLGVRPSMIMGKTRTNGGFGWHVFHDALSNNGEDQYLFLNLANAATTSAGIWSTTDSSVFNASPGLFAANETQVAYCFHSVEGYSKVGQYIGNYNVDGPFVYTGFRPAFIIIKSAVTSGYSWYMMDSTRTAYNGSQAWLSPDQTNAEDTSTGENVDILSNGFKIRTNWTRLNDSGSPTYIYLAFAETPFKHSTAK